MKIRKIGSLDQAVAVLENASAPDGPVRGLLEAVEKNTSLTRLPSIAAAALNTTTANGATSTNPRMQRLLAASKEADLRSVALDKPEAELERDFKSMHRIVQDSENNPPAINALLADLAELHQFMLEIKNSPDSAAASLTIAARRSGKVNGDAIGRLRRNSARFPEPLRSWITDISAMNWRVILTSARSHLNTIWRDEVYPVYQDGLRDRYPLVKSSREQATLTDFSRFFAPNGAIDGFFSDHLKPFVNTRARNWSLVQTDNQSLRIPSTVLKEFQYAAKVRDAYFDRESGNLALNFGLKPVHLDANVAKFSLDLDGQTNVYRHGPTRFTNFQWPGPANTGSVRLVFESLNGAQKSRLEEGPWAWFKILDQASVNNKSFADRLSINFNVGGLKSSYELHAKSVFNPFRLNELKNFRCPARL